MTLSVERKAGAAGVDVTLEVCPHSNALLIPSALRQLVDARSAHPLDVGHETVVDLVVDPLLHRTTGAIQQKIADRVSDSGSNRADERVRERTASLTKEIEERTAKIKVTEIQRSETLPFGGDKWGKDVIKKTVKGAVVTVSRDTSRAARALKRSVSCRFALAPTVSFSTVARRSSRSDVSAWASSSTPR